MKLDDMNDHTMDGLPVLKPDLTVVYPNKQELYRKEVSSPLVTIKRLMLAASLILTAGIVWWLTGDEQAGQAVPAVAQVKLIKSSGSATSENSKKLTASISEKSVAKVSVFIEAPSTLRPVDLIPEIVSESSDQKEMLLRDDVKEEIVAAAPEQPKSNFSEDALQAVALSAAKEVSVNVKANEEKAEIYVPVTVASEKKRPFRGLARKLSRTILGEGESLGEDHIIRVANFKIPVSN